MLGRSEEKLRASGELTRRVHFAVETDRPKVVRNMLGGRFQPSAEKRRANRSSAREPQGYFISFEGCERSGKTTQVEMLREYLEAGGVEVVVTREPGGTRLGERIREILLDSEMGEITPVAEALLFAANRSQVVNEVIRPALIDGIVVIADRFVDSSLAYQGVGRGLGLEPVKNLNEWATEGVGPDLTFYLDIPYEESLQRMGSDSADRIEGEPRQFHENVRQAYALLARIFPARFVIIDARNSIEAIHSRVITEVRQRLF